MKVDAFDYNLLFFRDDSGLCGVFVAVLLEIERFEDTGNFDVFKTVRQLKETNESMLDSEVENLVFISQVCQLLMMSKKYANLQFMKYTIYQHGVIYTAHLRQF